MTRRCSERRFFLRPSKKTDQAVLYILAVAAQRYGVLIHAFCVLSNHLHIVLTDPQGFLPDFMRDFNSLVARVLNSSIGHFEAFWASDGSYSAVEPIGPEAIVAKTAYALANPVAAGLVERGSDWPGLRTSPEQLGVAKLSVRRPDFFFDPASYMPERAELELTTPGGFASAEEFRALVAAQVRALEERHGREILSAGRRFLGAARVLAQDPYARPKPGEPRFQLKPRVASRDKWRRLEALSRLKTFLRAYRQAFIERRAGVATVVFPAGTYLLRVMHGVPCAAAP